MQTFNNAVNDLVIDAVRNWQETADVYVSNTDIEELAAKYSMNFYEVDEIVWGELHSVVNELKDYNLTSAWNPAEKG